MNFIRKIFSWRKSPPEWADFFTAEEYTRFLGLVQAYFAAQRRAIQIRDGIVTFEETDRYAGLHNLAQICHRANRRQWSEIISAHFQGFEEIESERELLEQKISHLSEIMEYLAVRIWSEDSLESIDREKIIYQKSLEGIISVLVFDLESMVLTVNRSEAVQWGKSPQELIQIGLQNVRKKSQPTISVVDIGDDLQVTILFGEEFFIATHGLFIEDHPECMGKYGSLMSIPHRHMVVCYPIEDERVVRAILKLIPVIYQWYKEGPGSISPSIYWFHDGVYTHLPVEMKEKEVIFTPPEEFGDLLSAIMDRNER